MASKHEPTETSRAEVRALAVFVSQDAISEYINIDKKTLRKHYARELYESRMKVHARVANFLINAATGAALTQGGGATFRDCLTAAIFYGKTRMNLRETDKTDMPEDIASVLNKLIDKLPD